MGSIVLGTALVVIGGGMMLRYRAVQARNLKKGVQQTQQQKTETYFAKRRRRRFRVGILTSVLGVFWLAGPLVSNPYWQVLYWGAALMIVAWLVILAIADMMRTQEHFGRLRTEYAVQRAALEAEIARLRKQAGSGAAEHEGNGNGQHESANG